MADCRPRQADDERPGEIAEAAVARTPQVSRCRFPASGIPERYGRRRGGLWHDSLPHDIDDLTAWQHLKRDHGHQILENHHSSPVVAFRHPFRVNFAEPLKATRPSTTMSF
jgi:hypothetical protein